MSQLTLRRIIKPVLEDEEEDLVEFDRGICSHWGGYVEKKIVHSITSGNSTSGLSSSGNCSTYKKGSGKSTSGLSSSRNFRTNEKGNVNSTSGLSYSGNCSIYKKGSGNSTSVLSSSGNSSTNEKGGGNSTSGLSSSGNFSTNEKSGGNSTSGLSSSGNCSTFKKGRGNSTSGLSSSGNFSTNEKSGGNSTSGLSSSGNCSTYKKGSGNCTSGLSSSENFSTNEKMSHVSRMHNEKVLKDLEVGDLVEFERGIFSHWGVYVGNEQIVHVVTNFNTKSGSSSSGNCCTNGSVGGNSTRGSSSSGHCCSNRSVGGYSISGSSSSGNCCTNGSIGGNSTSGSSSSGNCTTNECAAVIMESFWTVAGDSKATKNNQFDWRFNPLEKEKIKERAIEKLGQHKYNIIWNNCEHFAFWCRYDKCCSKQAEKCLRFVVGGAALTTSVLIIRELFFNKK